MRKTVEDVDKEIETKDIKINSLGDKKEISSQEIIKQLEELILADLRNKTDRVIKKLNEILEKHRKINC